jgi:hypothetical protein
MTPEQQRALALARARRRRAEEEQAQPVNDRAHVVAGGLIEGVPVVGPLVRGAADRVGAGIRSLINDTSYDDELAFVQGQSDRLADKHPVLDTGAKITGAVAGTLPLVVAAPAAFGAGGGSLLSRTAASGLSGMVIGGADAGVRSEGDLDAMKWGAGVGLAAGLAGPAAGQLIGKGVSALTQRFGRTAPTAAERMFGRALDADAVDDVAGRLLQMGPDAMPMDLGPNLQRQAGALAASPGRGQEITRSAIAARDAAANSRITGAVDDILGPATIPSQLDDAIRANQTVLSPDYDEVFKSARPVDASRLANILDSASKRLRGDAQKAAQKVRTMINVAGEDVLDTNPSTLFQTRQAIDDMLVNATPKEAQMLTVTRQEIDKLLTKSVPGIKGVDAKFQELARQRDAITRGQQVLESGRTAPRPTELASEFYDGAIPQGQMVGPSAAPLRLRQGARAEIDRIIGTNANDRVALQRLVKGEGDWNRARLQTLFGKERADRILNVLDAEKLFADTSHIVTRNAETAARTAAIRETAENTGGPGVIEQAGNLQFGTAGAKLFDKVLGSGRSAAQQKANEELAQLLVSRDPKNLGRVVQLVQQAVRRGDINGQRAREITQSLLIGTAPMPVRP